MAAQIFEIVSPKLESEVFYELCPMGNFTAPDLDDYLRWSESPAVFVLYWKLSSMFKAFSFSFGSWILTERFICLPVVLLKET